APRSRRWSSVAPHAVGRRAPASPWPTRLCSASFLGSPVRHRVTRSGPPLVWRGTDSSGHELYVQWGHFPRRQWESAYASLVPITGEEDPIAAGAQLAEGV